MKTVKLIPVAMACLAILSACNSGDNNTSASDSAKTTTVPVAVDSSATGTVVSSPAAPVDTTLSTTNPSAPKKVVARKSRKGRAYIKWETVNNSTSDAIAMDKEGIYNRTEVAPSFPGGQDALARYIQDHIEYPQDAVDNNKEGTVRLMFTVDERGKVSMPRAVSGNLGYGLDDEAIRVVSNMPNWKPGTIKGKNVKTRFTLPISYQIEP